MTPETTEKIKTKEDLVEFAGILLDDFKKNGSEWENKDIENFIEAFQAWLGSSEGFYKNMNTNYERVNPWREIGDALAAARIYE